ncbi:MAG: cell division protein ZapA [Desulfomonilia bacterium]
MHDTVTIRILGQEYTVKTGGDTNHVRALSRYIDEKVLNVQQEGKAVNTHELVAMVMLNMADDVVQAKAELETFKKTVSDKVDTLLHHIDKSIE